MAPPTGYSDFFELELQINYNNSANPYLQGFSPASGGLQPPQEQQAGWTERYLLNVALPVTSAPVQAYALTQARAALLGLNFYIKKAVCHQGSVFKSSWPMPNFASMPLFDNKANGSSLANQY